MNEPTFFEVLKHMADSDNKALRMAPLSNVDAVNYNHKKGTAITIGFPGNVAFEFAVGTLVGGLLLIDRGEYEKAKADLVREAVKP
jgi:hypothetical protein